MGGADVAQHEHLPGDAPPTATTIIITVLLLHFSVLLAAVSDDESGSDNTAGGAGTPVMPGGRGTAGGFHSALAGGAEGGLSLDSEGDGRSSLEVSALAVLAD